MQIHLDVLEEEIVQVGEGSFAAAVPIRPPRESLDSLQDVGLFFRREQVGHVSRVEDHADVLQEGLVLDLLVVEQEHDLLPVGTRLF